MAQYKALADIERSFKVLKSEIEVGPLHHRLSERIRAHALICFIALILQRLIRARLRAKPVQNVISPERAIRLTLKSRLVRQATQTKPIALQPM